MAFVPKDQAALGAWTAGAVDRLLAWAHAAATADLTVALVDTHPQRDEASSADPPTPDPALGPDSSATTLMAASPGWAPPGAAADPASLSAAGKTTTADSAAALLEGWGIKEGGLVKSWRRRHFVLRPLAQEASLASGNVAVDHPDALHQLLWFESAQHSLDNPTTPKGGVPVSPSTTAVKMFRKRNGAAHRCIRVETPGVSRVLYFEPDGGDAEASRWVSSLMTAQ